MKKNFLITLCIIPLMFSSYTKKQNTAAKVEKNKVFIEASKSQNEGNTTTGDIKNQVIPKVEKEKALALPRLDPSINESSLSRKEENWYFRPQKNGEPSGEPAEFTALTHKYYGYILGDTSKKVIYLTFDEGYEYGLTPKFLDILKENNVKASFFVTNYWIKSQPELAKRMVEEGQCVCNHSTTHPSMAKVTDKAKFTWELQTAENTFKEITGASLHKFFRPPMGKFSELSLYYTASLGYRTVFWSFAYVDWIPNQQKDPTYAKNLILSRTHNGAIYLLHGDSKTNANILDSVIKEWKAKGYTLETLDKLPEAPL